MSGEQFCNLLIDKPTSTGVTSLGSIIFGFAVADFLIWLQIISLTLGCMVAILSIIGWVKKFKNGSLSKKN